ncbi:hypothetical protein AC249_AIPGENE22802 [Exaiptasia diaphana]|nr:hypothetical protein AC249_AIPGENE22802 [Exaiptasia diaphana]
MRRFRKPKSKEEEANCVGSSVPKNTKYVTKWAVTLFCDWQKARNNKKAEFEETSFNFGDIKTLQDCDTNLEEMGAQSLNFWMIKFVQEVAKKDGDLYPPKTLNSIVCGINRYLEDKNDYNFMDKSDKRFSLLRKVMDAEMKESTKKGFGLKNTKPQREPVTAEEEEILWSKGLLGGSSVPKNTKYVTKWAVTLFCDWQKARNNKKAEFEETSFNFGDIKTLQDCDTNLEEMGAQSLNFWMIKFVQEVAKKDGDLYPPKTLNSIVCGINRYLEDKNDYNFMDKSDKRFSLLRKVMDAEMKESTKKGFGLKNTKPQREPVTAEEEEILWSKGLLGGPCNSEANDSTNYPSFEFNLFDTLGDNVFDNVISDETLCSINLSDDDLMFNEDVADEILAGIDYESATTSVTRPTPKVSEACTASPPKLVFSNCTFTNVTFTNSK